MEEMKTYVESKASELKKAEFKMWKLKEKNAILKIANNIKKRKNNLRLYHCPLHIFLCKVK